MAINGADSLYHSADARMGDLSEIKRVNPYGVSYNWRPSSVLDASFYSCAGGCTRLRVEDLCTALTAVSVLLVQFFWIPIHTSPSAEFHSLETGWVGKNERRTKSIKYRGLLRCVTKITYIVTNPLGPIRHGIANPSPTERNGQVLVRVQHFRVDGRAIRAPTRT